MKRKQFNFFIGCLALLILGCSTEDHDLQQMTQIALNPVLDQADKQAKAGATQISGVAVFGADCEDVGGQGALFALRLTGDLEGCLYVFVESFDCSPQWYLSRARNRAFHWNITWRRRFL